MLHKYLINSIFSVSDIMIVYKKLAIALEKSTHTWRKQLLSHLFEQAMNGKFTDLFRKDRRNINNKHWQEKAASSSY